MTTAAIVQARFGSTRLPGKVLLELDGRPVLAHVLSRCSRISGIDFVVCAMPDEAASDKIEEIAAACGAVTFRGSESDVLARYLGAARLVDADVVLRITSDCPLIDPKVAADVVALRAAKRCDYASNNLSRTFPHGLDCEAFTFEALAEADTRAHEAYDREHVTPWLRRSRDIVRANLDSGNPALAQHRWTLDHPEDMAFFKALFAVMVEGVDGTMDDILSVLAAHPEIPSINQHRHAV